MKKEIPRKAAGYIRTHRLQRRWRKIVTCLAAVVVFCTAYALILPAITLENDQIPDGSPVCGTDGTEEDNAYRSTDEYPENTEANITLLAADNDTEADTQAANTEPQNTDTQAADTELQNTDTQAANTEPQNTGTQAASTEPQNTNVRTVNVEPHNTNVRAVNVEPQNTDVRAANVEPQNTDVQTAKYTRVDKGFFLWLRLFDENEEIQDVYINPEWSINTHRFEGEGIEDALTYTEDDEAWYLIPVSYFVDAYGKYGYSFDSAAACPFRYAPNAYDSAANLTEAEYVYVDSGELSGDAEACGWYVRVQDTGNYSNPNDPNNQDNPRSNIYYTVPAQEVTDTVSPSGTVINLFDYWTTSKEEMDVTYNNYDSGINAGHALKFKATGLAGANTWTGTADVYPGIVANTLGKDGYPHLSGEQIFGNAEGTVVSGDESLAYLFDPVYGDSGSCRDAYRNVTGLLQVDENGYYYYDSTKNYAEFDSTKNGFTLYDQWSLTYTSDNQNTIKGQFFPFNPYNTVSKSTTAKDDSLNHFFGMTLTTRFVQQYDGHTNPARKTETTFEFSGDDDVWIFIDDVLVADLGGIHDPASVTINFATGDIVINEGKEYESRSTLYKAFEAAGATDRVEWRTDDDGEGRSDTFANNTYHTLRFYYLERGSFASNLSLRYNLSPYPPTGINKVNQYGDAVAGAEFSVYPATVDAGGVWTYEENNAPAYTGITDDTGEMIFVDEDNMPYTMAELKNMFGEYFILKETQAPDGYRLVSEEIKLHIVNGVIVCENTYESGVWADANLQVSAPNVVKLADDTLKTVVSDDLEENGRIFAVVLKYIGDPLDADNAAQELSRQENWAPVYGTSMEGFTVVDVGKDFGGDFISAAISTAKQYVESDNVFAMSAGNGVLMGTLNGVPGDLMTYYYMLSADEKYKTQYTVAYYWTEAESLDEATSANTRRIEADARGYAFDRAFGSTINVPNLLNLLFVQKLDENDERINGARFAMYSVEERKDDSEADSSTIYYIADDGARIFLAPDTDGDNEGEARLRDAGTGVYTVDGASGIIAVHADNQTYHITPRPYAMEGGGTAVTVAAGSENNPTGEDGTAAFTNMDPGTYYVREIAAPSGYIINPTEIMVLVDESAVYANAGTAGDGVNVARGTGYLVSSLDQFASQGDIDNTLTWLFEMMRVSPESTSFADADFVHSEAYRNWGYLMKNYDGQHLTQTTDQHIADNALRTYLAYSPDAENNLFNYVMNTQREGGGDTRRLYTNVGWSYYELYQDWRWALGYEGVEAHKNEHAAYTVLTENGEAGGRLLEIANLFSRAVYIQVTDARVGGELEIGKTVVNAGNAPEEDSGSYAFTVTLKDAAGSLLSGSYPYTVYDITYDADGRETGRTPTMRTADGEEKTEYSGVIAGGTLDFILSECQAAVIENLPAGTQYIVTEKGTGEFITTAQEKVRKEPSSSGDGEDFVPYGWNTYSFGANEGNRTVEGTLYWYADEAGTVDTRSVVNYTNSYLPDLTILKVDAGNQTVSLEGAEFVLCQTVTAEAADGKEERTETRYYSGDGQWAELPEDGDNTVMPEAVRQTTGKDGKIVYLNIPDGIYCLEEVKAPDGYRLLTDKITLTVRGGEIAEAFMGGVPCSSHGEEVWLTLTVANSFDFTLPETGGAGTNLFTAGGLLLMAGAVGCGYGLRRGRERRRRN